METEIEFAGPLAQKVSIRLGAQLHIERYVVIGRNRVHLEGQHLPGQLDGRHNALRRLLARRWNFQIQIGDPGRILDPSHQPGQVLA